MLDVCFVLFAFSWLRYSPSLGFRIVLCRLCFGCFWFGTLMGGRYRETASCPILQSVPSNGSLLLLSSFFTVCIKIQIRCAFIVCDFVATRRVDPEDCVMVFQHIFGPQHQHPQICFHSKCGSGPLQAWTVVGSMMMLIFSVSGSRCNLLCSIQGRVFIFDATRLNAFLYHVCVDVHQMCCVSCR